MGFWINAYKDAGFIAANKIRDVNEMDAMANVKVTAHAGCMGTSMDSMESVVAAVQINADICEVDVNLLGDGTLVLKHNDVLPGDINLVRLSRVFEYISDKNIALNLDIKNINAVDKVISEASKYGVYSKVFLTGIGEESAEKLQKSGCSIRYYLNHNIRSRFLVINYHKYLDGLIDTMRKLGCVGLNTEYFNCTREAVDKVRKAGLLVSVWTVNNAISMKKLIKMGVDNITTRHPDVLINILNKN